LFAGGPADRSCVDAASKNNVCGTVSCAADPDAAVESETSKTTVAETTRIAITGLHSVT
jgi:hypothetical protein